MARHTRSAGLCDRLEACADALPTWPVKDEAERLCSALYEFIGHDGRATVELAKMLGPGRPDDLTAALLRHVEARRTEDLVHAGDLMAVLDAVPAEAGRISADTLGYMLRCFFAARRQMMVFEMLAVLMLGENRLTADGRSLLIDGLHRRAA
jgi:hypothetical protein